MDQSMHTIERTLHAHGIETRYRAGRLEAAEVLTLYGRVLVEWVDVSDWTTKQLRAWLGY